MSLALTSLQQRYLDAMGYTLYALAGAGTVSIAMDQAPPSTRPGTRPSNAAKLTSSVPPAVLNPREQRLLDAVLKAAHANIETIGDAGEWLIARGVASISALRNDPAAKRALWIQLRRERRAP